MSMALQEVSFISRMLLAAVFLVAAAGKSRAPRAFAQTIQQLGPRPIHAQRAAWLVIGYEGIVGLFLALGLAPLLTAVATLSLLLVFGGVSVYALVSHQRIPCNCFGQANVPLGRHTLTRAVLLLVPACALAWSARSVVQPWWPDTPALLVPLLSLVLAAILIARWLLTVPDMMQIIADRRQVAVELKNNGDGT